MTPGTNVITRSFNARVPVRGKYFFTFYLLSRYITRVYYDYYNAVVLKTATVQRSAETFHTLREKFRLNILIENSDKRPERS